MIPARVVLLVTASAVSAALAVACASAPPSNKTMVVECDEDQAEPCSEDSPTNTRRGSSSSGSSGSGPTDTPDEVDPSTPPTNADAGRVDAASSSSSSSSGGAGTRGPSCTALAACCEKIERAGFTGSARQCRSVVSTNNEYACSVTKADYARPTEEYDAICP